MPLPKTLERWKLWLDGIKGSSKRYDAGRGQAGARAVEPEPGVGGAGDWVFGSSELPLLAGGEGAIPRPVAKLLRLAAAAKLTQEQLEAL